MFDLNLTMDRSKIALPGDMVRAFSGRGSVSIRDHTVTGLQNLQMTPIEHRGWEFDLKFVDRRTGAVIFDRADLVWKYHRETGLGMHPLALNFGSGVGASSYDPAVGDDDRENAAESTSYLRNLIVQWATWSPNKILRGGTYHKRINGHLTSFEIVSETIASPLGDEVFLTLQLRNRTDEQLELDITPNQRVKLGFTVDPREDDASDQLDWNVISAPTLQWPGGRQSQVEFFTSQVTSDLPAAESNWRLAVPAGESLSAIFRIAFAAVGGPALPKTEPGLADERDSVLGEYESSRETFLKRAPKIQSTPDVEKLYEKSLHTLFEARWVRSDWAISPFYSAGTWLATLAWDVSFSSEILAVLEPEALRRTLVALFSAGVNSHSYVLWDGGFGPHYSYTFFAAVRALRDYLAVTGDQGVLAQELSSGRSLAQELAFAMNHVLENNREPLGLIWFSDETSDYNETRTDGHQGAVAAINLVAIDVLLWLADSPACELGDRLKFQKATHLIRSELDSLWDPEARWFANRMSDSSTEIFMSYQHYDAIGSSALRSGEAEGLISHLREGEFLGEFGMYSVSRADTTHFDLDDADWGGGGQYTGMPLRIAQDLWAGGWTDAAWSILSRCFAWSDAFPYIPQEIHTASLTTPDIEQAVEVAAGAGAQAIIFGIFGLRPQADGGLLIEPAFHQTMLGSKLLDYPHRHGLVSVALLEDGFEVRVGELVIRKHYGESFAIQALPTRPSR